MIPLRIVATAHVHGARHDFGAEVKEGTLLVAPDVADALSRLAVRTAAQFVNYLNTFPSAVANELGWSVEDVLQARATLVEALRDRVPDAILAPPSVTKRAYGAFPPSALPHHRRGR